MTSKKVSLKKYPNRRLYNTENSSYVTLSDVADMIQEGRQVEVTDQKTEQDVTAFILTQVIMEQTRRNNKLLPVSLLHLIIRSGENVLQDFFENYLEQSLVNYLNYKKNMQEQFRFCLELGIDLSGMTEKTLSDLSSFPAYSAKKNTEKSSPDANNGNEDLNPAV
ncbi:MAG: polyhydroxyalkanoate synthesis repressor PhaR [Desulfococcaceae bacterium]|nr:polyhydroxyalkanoate synthesis repressor PhaR [Desulfococcaceae bacterium]